MCIAFTDYKTLSARIIMSNIQDIASDLVKYFFKIHGVLQMRCHRKSNSENVQHFREQSVCCT